MTGAGRQAAALAAIILLVSLAPGCVDDDGGGGGGEKGPGPLARVHSSGSTVNQGEEVTFDGLLSNGTGLEYSWDMGDGIRETGPEATRTFTHTGAYTVTLTVEDKWGRTDQDSVIVKVNYHELSEGTLDHGDSEYSRTIPVEENAAGFRITLTYPSGQAVAGQPSNDLDLYVYYPNGTEAWSTSGDDPDAGELQEESLEVPQQMLAEVFWQDWDLTVRRSMGLAVDFSLDVLVMY